MSQNPQEENIPQRGASSPFNRRVRYDDDPGFATGLITSPRQEKILRDNEIKKAIEKAALESQRRGGHSAPTVPSPPRPGELTRPVELLPRLNRKQLEWHQRRAGIEPRRGEEEDLSVPEGESLTRVQLFRSRSSLLRPHGPTCPDPPYALQSWQTLQPDG